jgi:hypothetical protein
MKILLPGKIGLKIIIKPFPKNTFSKFGHPKKSPSGYTF